MVRKARKGQVFLADNEVLRRIADAARLTADDVVLEIGMGRGELTQHLVRRAREVIAVEVEERFVGEAASYFARWDNLTVVHADILDLKWEDVLPAGEKVVVVGNIPFYITGPILRKLFDYRPVIKRWLLMFQEEVARRIVASPGSPSYGALSVKMQRWGRPELEFVIPRSAFRPLPEVAAAVVSYQFEDAGVPTEEMELFNMFVDYVFGGRRRKVVNRLAEFFAAGKEKEDVRDVLRSVGVPADARPGDIAPLSFWELFSRLRDYFSGKVKFYVK